MSREWTTTGLIEGPISEAEKAKAEVKRLRDALHHALGDITAAATSPDPRSAGRKLAELGNRLEAELESEQ